MDFDGNAAEQQEFELNLDAGFTTYQSEGPSTRPWCSTGDSTFRSVSPGQSVAIITTSDARVDWTAPVPYNDAAALKESAVMAINTTGSEQSVALCLQSGPIVAFPPIKNDARIIAPLDLVVQAYVVHSSTKYWRNILSGGDLQDPLMAKPLSCASLPPVCTMRLCEDQNGDMRLESLSGAQSGGLSNEEIANSLSDIKIQLDYLIKAVSDTDDRLTKVESSVTQAQNVVEPGKKALEDAPLEPGGAVETKVEELKKSFGQTQEYLAGVQKFLQTTRGQMAALERVVPAVQAKTDKLAESQAQTQGDVALLKETSAKHENLLGFLDGRLAILEPQGEGGDGSPILFSGKPSGSSGPAPDSADIPLFPWAGEAETPGPPPA